MSDSHPEQRQEGTVSSDAAQSAKEAWAEDRPAADAAEGETTQTFAYVFSSPPREEREDDPADSEPTVISKQTPLAPLPAWSTLAPRELGNHLLGRKLDHFQLDEFIGGGGMGAVFRARDTLLGRTVAVKVLATGAAGNEENRVRFHNEAQSAARLDHPNIARVHYVGEAEGFKYIVFEYLQGKNLRDLVADMGPLPLTDALNFTLQIAEALAHAWQRDIVHRDIKPSNVLATPEGQVKLVDMGLARLKDVATPAVDVTASGVTLGTFDYISPEQARDPRTADIRSDIYSLGCTLYFMLCGRPPFQGGTAVQKLLMHQADEPPHLSEYRPDLPPSVEQFLRRMLAKRPEDRFQNPAELIAAVTTLAAEVGVAVHPTTTVQLTVAEQRNSWLTSSLPWLVPTVLLLVCVFILDYVDRRTEAMTSPWPQQRQVAENESRSSGPAASQGRDRTTRENGAMGQDAPSAAEQSAGRTESFLPRVSPPAPGDTPAVVSGDASTSDEARSASDAAGNLDDTPLSLAPWLTAIRSWPAKLLEQFPAVTPGGSGMSSPREGRAAPARPASGVRNTVRRTHHPTLAEAIAEARDGDALEILEDGVTRLEKSSLPIRVKQKEIALRAGEGVSPVLQAVTSAEPGRSEGALAMFAVDDGSIRIEGVGLELTPRTLFDSPVTGWKIFRLGVGGSAEIADCWMTIHGHTNARSDMYTPDFFHVVGPTRPFTDGDTKTTAKKVRIDLNNVIARGGDTLVSVEGDAHLFVSVQNGLLAMRGYLFDGARRDAMDLGQIDIQLDHITAHLGRGGFKIRGLGRSEDLQIGVHNSILVGAPGSFLVEHGVDYATPSTSVTESLDVITDDRLPLVWDGQRNIYGGWDFAFQRQVANGAGKTLTFADWLTYWNKTVQGAEVQPFPQQSVPWHAPRDIDAPPLVGRTPSDYLVLVDVADQQMLAWLDEGSDFPGLNPDLLPSHPQNGSAEASAATPSRSATDDGAVLGGQQPEYRRGSTVTPMTD